MTPILDEARPAAAGDSGAMGIGAMVAALREAGCYPHPTGEVAVIETHISYVLLAGEFAYKLKKPVRLPFLDFSTLESRRRFCLEEVRLNRRTAPGIYLDVVPVTLHRGALRMGGEGPAIEHAVRMKRFPQEALLGRLAAEGCLEAEHVEALADAVAAFHGVIAGEAAPEGLRKGVPEAAEDNFEELGRLPAARGHRPLLAQLREWTLAERACLEERFAARRRGGFVRECHGDLHLANAFLDGGKAVLFDAVEFDRDLRWTDVMSDVGFAFMDLARHGNGRLAWHFLDRYLERTGDFGGLAVLRFNAVYRATVRAKVAAIRAAQAVASEPASLDVARELESHLKLARRLSAPSPRLLVLMHGFSGAGKSAVSRELVAMLGAIRVRSDVERRRIHGISGQGGGGSPPAGGIYTASANDLTYARLAEAASEALRAGYPAIVDAAFLGHERRAAFSALARRHEAVFQIVSCRAPEETLRERIRRRERSADEASQAGEEVLALQLAGNEPLFAEELLHTTIIDTSAPEWRREAAAFARRFRIQAV